MPARGFATTTRQEQIADITLNNVNSVYVLPTNGGLIPNDRFLGGLFLTFQGRMTNPAANFPTGTQADAPFSLIENITVSGYHRVRGANEPFINLRGVDLYNLLRVQLGIIPAVSPNSAGAPTFTPSLATGTNATNDIKFTLYLPFWPLMLPIRSQLGWALDAPNYDQLQLKVTFSDALSVFTGQTTQPTFSAFGSATGSPTLRVEGQFLLGGNSLLGFVPARTWRYHTENLTGDILATVTGSRQFNIPRGNRVRSILMKTGVKSTTVTAGNNAYNTYSDSIFSNIKVARGLNKNIRLYNAYDRIKAENQYAYGMYPQTGYALLDWAQKGLLSEVLDTTGMVAGPSGDTDLAVFADIAGAANQASLFLMEELRGIPRKIA